MRRIGVRSLCLVVLATSVVAVPSAAAAPPEFGRCIAKAGGVFANAGCSKIEAGKNKFEWIPGVTKTHFTSKLKEGLPTLETVSGTKITCTAEEGAGNISGEKKVNEVTAKFNGCETTGLACQNGVSKEINTKTLAGELGIEKKGLEPAKDKIGELMRAETGTVLAEFECAGLTVVVRGSVIHPIPANKMLSVTTEKYSQKGGKQKPEKFEGQPKTIIESSTAGGQFEQAGQAIIVTVTFEEKGEVSSVN
jgi:hypothetical protein